MSIPTAYPRPLRAATTFPVQGRRCLIKHLMMQESGYGRYPMMFEFQQGSGGGVTLHIDGVKESAFRGHGYDKAGRALAQWFCRAFADELKEIFARPRHRKALGLPDLNYFDDGSRNPWYGVLLNEKTGRIEIVGQVSLTHVIAIMERTVGLSLRLLGHTRTSSIYLLCRNRPSKG